MKRIYPLLSLLLLLFVFTSCKKNNVIKPGIDTGINLVLTAAEQQNAVADNAFTFSLFKTVAAETTNGSNLFMSPLSVSLAMGMTGNGASGQTLTDINTAMNLTGFNQDQVNSYYNKLITDLPKLDPNTTLKIANSIWYKQGFSVLPQFLQTDSSFYHAKMQALDFSDPSSLNTINTWVGNQTNGKITKIINEIGPDDVMYLINAIYFKSTWLNKFDPAKTQKMAFNLADNSQVQADFMHGTISVKTYAGNNATLLELPYSNSKFSMVIVMPAAGKTINDIIPSLDGAAWQSWMSNLLPASVDVLMPKFQFSYSVSLNNALTTLGMGSAFTKDADFSRISAGGNLKITAVNHKAYVAVDEDGTEAAAATSVTVTATAVMEHQITINHPFIFVIREMNTGLILFAGTVNNPLQNGL
ncbi:MAG: serpin family protein [Mucilaginibacter sp.]|nr:serpin family protein [Mucilaginibacter sp.]